MDSNPCIDSVFHPRRFTEHGTPTATVGQRVAFADAAQTGRLVSEVDEDSPAAREIAALCAEVGRIAP